MISNEEDYEVFRGRSDKVGEEIKANGSRDYLLGELGSMKG